MDQIPSRVIRFGKNPIYLPKFTITLLRTPKLSPYHAKFQVPLYFSKLDLRDYLYNAYNVRALSIRSVVQQQPVRDHVDAMRQFFRPESKKFMTIEMDKPFVWPAEPESWEPWGKSERAKRDQYAIDEAVGGDTVAIRKEALALREQAQALLEGRALVEEEEKKEGEQEQEKELGVEEVRKEDKVATKGDAQVALKAWKKSRTLKQIELDQSKGYKIRV